MATQYAVFGNPVAHSKSPAIHKAFAEQTQQAISYDKRHIDLDAFNTSVRTFFSEGGGGLNITVPFKLEAYNLAEKLTLRADKAGAVNTLYMDNNILTGDNTDGVGLCRDLMENLNWPVKQARVLVLGAGGAVRGIINPLLECGVTSIVIANRTVAKAEELAALFNNDAHLMSSSINACSYDGLCEGFDLVINGTSLSLSNELPPIPPNIVNHAYCYDMMYSATPTAFLQWAAKNGAIRIADGLGMLVEQAAESFYIWRKVKPNTRPVIDTIRTSLITS